MSHLNLETLARLVDEAPAESEAVHLAACAACRVELEALREDVQALAMLPDMAPAPDAWNALEARLLDEGIMRRRTLPFAVNRFAQVAAVLVVFAAGTAAGRLTADPDAALIARLEQATSAAARPQTPATPPATPTFVGGGDSAADIAGGSTQRVAAATDDVVTGREPAPVRPQTRQSPVSFASTGGRLPQARNLDEAAALLRETEEWYLSALTRYAELTTQSEVNDPIARLAALQSIVMTTQAALSQTPSDPVINGAHLTAVAQRDAALRQVAAATGERWH